MGIHPAIQPTLCIIGCPVAGNAMQFAMERSLAEAGLDWKFASFNVQPESFDEAMCGAKALGIAGIALAPPFESMAVPHAQQTDPQSGADRWLDSLHRVQRQWVGRNQLGRSVMQNTLEAMPTCSRAVILGQGVRGQAIATYFAANGVRCQLVATNHRPASSHAREDRCDQRSMIQWVDSLPSEGLGVDTVVVRADDQDGAPCAIDHLEQTTFNDAGCCVELDLEPNESMRTLDQVDRISAVDIMVQQYNNNFFDWTGVKANLGTLREAVEEYFEL